MIAGTNLGGAITVYLFISFSLMFFWRLEHNNDYPLVWFRSLLWPLDALRGLARGARDWWRS